MARLSYLAVFLPVLAHLAGAAPISVTQSLSRRAFALQQYADFQISGGTGGTAEDEANAVFTVPFQGLNLATDVSATDLSNLQTMREAAEDAETELFDPQIDAASGTTADALQVGKIKNKVLKLTGEIMGINIEIAQAQATGKDTSDLETSLQGEQTKLNSNLALDKANAGKTSQAASGTPS